jgi:hypothetical protein
MLKSIIKSKKAIGRNAFKRLTGMSPIPDIATLANKSWQELRSLTISQVQWFENRTIGFTLNDNQSCKAGSKVNFKSIHNFDPAKKITKVECIIDDSLHFVEQINFYSYKEILVRVGWTEEVGKYYGGKEVFDIAEDEQLIGCELDHCKRIFRGVTWIKMKVPKADSKKK